MGFVAFRFISTIIQAFIIFHYNRRTKLAHGFSTLRSFSCKNGLHHGSTCFYQMSKPQFTVVTTTNLSVSKISDVVEKDLKDSMKQCVEILNKAAETKQEDADVVCKALVDLERLARQQARLDETFAQRTLTTLEGDWRLIFTTGTANTQKKLGGARINYFPLKAVQSFRTTDQNPMLIENGIYIGDVPVLKFRGTFEFDLRKRKLEFDFDNLLLFNFFDVKLGKGEAASIGAKSGLGSDSNVKRSEKGQKSFFNWIHADDTIATARGGGGGLALWKRL